MQQNTRTHREKQIKTQSKNTHTKKYRAISLGYKHRAKNRTSRSAHVASGTENKTRKSKTLSQHVPQLTTHHQYRHRHQPQHGTAHNTGGVDKREEKALMGALYIGKAVAGAIGSLYCHGASHLRQVRCLVETVGAC